MLDMARNAIGLMAVKRVSRAAKNTTSPLPDIALAQVLLQCQPPQHQPPLLRTCLPREGVATDVKDEKAQQGADVDLTEH